VRGVIVGHWLTIRRAHVAGGRWLLAGAQYL
jgi:hypothetical protein